MESFVFESMQFSSLNLTTSFEANWTICSAHNENGRISLHFFCSQLLFIISCFRWYVSLSSSSSSSPQIPYRKFWKYFCHSFWHQSSLTYSVGIVSSTNSQPKQYFEQLAPVQPLRMFGLCQRYVWRFSELIDSEGFGSYLTFPKVLWISPKVFGYFSRSVTIHGYHLLSRCLKNGCGLNIIKIEFISFFQPVSSIFSILFFNSSSRVMEDYKYSFWTFLFFISDFNYLKYDFLSRRITFSIQVQSGRFVFSPGFR